MEKWKFGIDNNKMINLVLSNKKEPHHIYI